MTTFSPAVQAYVDRASAMVRDAFDACELDLEDRAVRRAICAVQLMIDTQLGADASADVRVNAALAVLRGIDDQLGRQR